MSAAAEATPAAYQRGLTEFISIVRAYRALLNQSGKSLEFQRDKLIELLEFIGNDSEDFTFGLGVAVTELPAEYVEDGYSAELLTEMKEALRVGIQRMSALIADHHMNLADVKRGIATTFRLYYNFPAQTGGNRTQRKRINKKNKRARNQTHNRKTRTKTMNMNWLLRRVNSLTLRNLQREESYLTEKE